jgi:hypothetical protein
VAIDPHGSEDRAKDVSTAGARDGSSILRPVQARRCAHADSVPFLGDLGTSDVVGRAADRGGAPLSTDEPTEGLHSDVNPRRTTSSRRPGRLPPSRTRDAQGCGLLHISCVSASVPRSRRPHLFREGEDALVGHCKHLVPRSPAIRGIRETSAFVTRWTARAWD